MSPEILDADLASTVMISASWGALRRDDLPWLTVPPVSSWDRARNLLKLLGAIDDDGRLCEHGEKMAKLPMHPRLANMMLQGGEASLAAILEEGVRSRETDIRYVKRTPRMRELSRRFSAYELPSRGFSQGSMLALAYPERIAKNRGNGTFRMVSGRGAFFEDGEALAKEPYVVCCELDAREQDAKVFLAAPISEKEIFDLFADRMVERRVCLWDRRTDGVKCTLAKYLGEMSLCEKQVKPDDIEAVSCILEGVRLKGVENMPCWSEGALAMKARIDFLHRHFPDTWPEVSDERMLAALKNFVSGMTRWRDLERIDLTLVMDLILADSGHDRRELDSLAPKRMDVPSGSSVKISYEGQEPTAEVRLQECFGLMQTPKVALGTVPIVMTLLSPAARPIQVTKDLEGFWRGAYQLVRKDMRGRYPKHYWPEDPFTAVATKRVRPVSTK
jgi:ATP-dependent helicase HrpB